MIGVWHNETIEQALDKGAPIGVIAAHFGLSRAEVTECSRRRDNARKAKALRRAALDQRKKRKEEAMKFFWQNKLPKGPDLREGLEWSEHEYALLQGLINIGKVSAASRVLRRSQEDIDQAVVGLGRRARLREEEKTKNRTASEARIALYQRVKEAEIKAKWGELQEARRAPSRETLQPIARKLKLTHAENITINGKNYTRLLDQAMRIVRARIEIVAAIGK